MNFASQTMSGRWTQYGVQGLEAIGVDVSAICREIGLDYDAVTDPTAWIEHAAFARLWSKAVRTTKDPNLGLHAAERFQPAARDLLTHLLISCATLGEGIERATGFYELSGDPVGPRLIRRPAESVLRLADRQNDHSAWTEFRLAAYLRFTELAVQREIQPLEVRFRHPDRGAPTELYLRGYRCRAAFGAGENCIVLPEDALGLPLPSASEDVALTLEKAAAIAVCERVSSSLESRVRLRIRSALPQGGCSESAVASALHMSVSTLKRRLADVQRNFTDLIDDVRMRVVLDLLVSTTAPLENIARDVGYANAGSLVRAMKRWTGHTPGAFRAARGDSQASQSDLRAGA